LPHNERHAAALGVVRRPGAAAAAAAIGNLNPKGKASRNQGKQAAIPASVGAVGTVYQFLRSAI